MYMCINNGRILNFLWSREGHNTVIISDISKYICIQSAFIVSYVREIDAKLQFDMLLKQKYGNTCSNTAFLTDISLHMLE